MPLARSAPEGTARCEPLTFAPLRSFHPSPWPIQRPSLLGSSTRPGTEIPDDVPLRPSIDISTQRPLPRRPEGRRFGLEGATPEVSFRPRGFSPPRRLPPLCRLRACCIPLPILGSTALLPAVQDRTPRRIPRRQPLRVTAVVAPLPFLPASRPCSVVESGVAARRCQLTMTRSSLGFVPLQGSLRCGRRSISHRHLPANPHPRRDGSRRGSSVVAPGICFATEVASTGHPRRRSGVGVNRAR